MAERTIQQHVEAESLLQKYQSLPRGGNQRSEYLKSLKVSELQVLLTGYSPSVSFKNMLKIPLRELLEQHINDYALVPQPAAIISSTVPGSSMLPSISMRIEGSRPKGRVQISRAQLYHSHLYRKLLRAAELLQNLRSSLIHKRHTTIFSVMYK